MQTWIRADAEFGIPYVVIRIPHRILLNLASTAVNRSRTGREDHRIDSEQGFTLTGVGHEPVATLA
jgi:hypothetical protein